MFGNASDPSRIWSFKARTPSEGILATIDQIWLAYRYKNKLIEIERERRESVDRTIREMHPEVLELTESVDGLEKELEVAISAVTKKNSEQRKRKTESVDRQVIAMFRKDLKEARKNLKDARIVAFADEATKTALKAIDEASAEAAKKARKESGVYWGTYLQVEAALSTIRKGSPPKFRRWEKQGSVSVQIQKGMTWDEATACTDSRLRVQILPAVYAGGPRRSKAGRVLQAPSPDSARTLNDRVARVWFRIGSGERGVPVWTTFTVRFHRTPPADAQIKWVHLHQLRFGQTEHWQFNIVLSREDGFPRVGQAAGGTAGVDIGWRRMDDGGLRIAYLVGDDGHEEELRMTGRDVGAWEKSRSLQSIRDRNFNDIRDKLKAWIHDHTVYSDGEPPATAFPEWFSKRTEFIAQWKSPERLIGLIGAPIDSRRAIDSGRESYAWRDNRFEGDESIFPALESWRKQDKHLADWAANNIRKAIARRNLRYRQWAARLSRMYKTLILEDINIREMTGRPAAEEDDTARSARLLFGIAATGKLRLFLGEAMTAIKKVDAQNTTKECNACGHINEFDSKKNLNHACDACGVEWDQDRNAATNLLRAGTAVEAGAGTE